MRKTIRVTFASLNTSPLPILATQTSDPDSGISSNQRTQAAPPLTRGTLGRMYLIPAYIPFLYPCPGADSWTPDRIDIGDR